jgi:hypothetical protein
MTHEARAADPAPCLAKVGLGQNARYWGWDALPFKRAE